MESMLRGKQGQVQLSMRRYKTELERADWCREWSLEDKLPLLLLPAHTNCSFYTDTDTELRLSHCLLCLGL